MKKTKHTIYKSHWTQSCSFGRGGGGYFRKTKNSSACLGFVLDLFEMFASHYRKLFLFSLKWLLPLPESHVALRPKGESRLVIEPFISRNTSETMKEVQLSLESEKKYANKKLLRQFDARYHVSGCAHFQDLTKSTQAWGWTFLWLAFLFQSCPRELSDWIAIGCLSNIIVGTHFSSVLP